MKSTAICEERKHIKDLLVSTGSWACGEIDCDTRNSDCDYNLSMWSQCGVGYLFIYALIFNNRTFRFGWVILTKMEDGSTNVFANLVKNLNKNPCM